MNHNWMQANELHTWPQAKHGIWRAPHFQWEPHWHIFQLDILLGSLLPFFLAGDPKSIVLTNQRTPIQKASPNSEREPKFRYTSCIQVCAVAECSYLPALLFQSSQGSWIPFQLVKMRIQSCLSFLLTLISQKGLSISLFLGPLPMILSLMSLDLNIYEHNLTLCR